MEDEVEYSIDDVATKLRKSRRWLERRLAEDLRKMPAERTLQHHYRIGASKRWDEERYQALRVGIIEQDGDARKENPRVHYTYQGPLPSADNLSGSEKLLASLRRQRGAGRSPKGPSTVARARRKAR